MKIGLFLTAAALIALPSSLTAQRGSNTPNARHPGSAVLRARRDEQDLLPSFAARPGDRVTALPKNTLPFVR